MMDKKLNDFIIDYINNWNKNNSFCPLKNEFQLIEVQSISENGKDEHWISTSLIKRKYVLKLNVNIELMTDFKDIQLFAYNDYIKVNFKTSEFLENTFYSSSDKLFLTYLDYSDLNSFSNKEIANVICKRRFDIIPLEECDKLIEIYLNKKRNDLNLLDNVLIYYECYAVISYNNSKYIHSLVKHNLEKIISDAKEISKHDKRAKYLLEKYNWNLQSFIWKWNDAHNNLIQINKHGVFEMVKSKEWIETNLSKAYCLNFSSDYKYGIIITLNELSIPTIEKYSIKIDEEYDLLIIKILKPEFYEILGTKRNKHGSYWVCTFPIRYLLEKNYRQIGRLISKSISESLSTDYYSLTKEIANKCSSIELIHNLQNDLSNENFEFFFVFDEKFNPQKALENKLVSIIRKYYKDNGLDI